VELCFQKKLNYDYKNQSFFSILHKMLSVGLIFILNLRTWSRNVVNLQLKLHQALNYLLFYIFLPNFCKTDKYLFSDSTSSCMLQCLIKINSTCLNIYLSI
jgi:hypothetical protein